jgi:hypothetical protein
MKTLGLKRVAVTCILSDLDLIPTLDLDKSAQNNTTRSVYSESDTMTTIHPNTSRPNTRPSSLAA